MAVRWYGEFHSGRVSDAICERDYLEVLWDSEYSRSVVPVTDILRHALVHALANFDAAEYGAEYLSLQGGDLVGHVEQSANMGWSFALHMAKGTSGWVPTNLVLSRLEV